MTGAELLALARHSRGSSEGDADTAEHLAHALSLMFYDLTLQQRHRIAGILDMMADDFGETYETDHVVTNS